MTKAEKKIITTKVFSGKACPNVHHIYIEQSDSRQAIGYIDLDDKKITINKRFLDSINFKINIVTY